MMVPFILSREGGAYVCFAFVAFLSFGEERALQCGWGYVKEKPTLSFL